MTSSTTGTNNAGGGKNLRDQSRSRGQISQKSAEKYNDGESGVNGNPTGLNNKATEEPFSGTVTPSKTEEVDAPAQSSGFQFVSFKIEPSKNMQKTMKKRDKNKPLIDEAIIKRQVNF